MAAVQLTRTMGMTNKPLGPLSAIGPYHVIHVMRTVTREVAG